MKSMPYFSRLSYNPSAERDVTRPGPPPVPPGPDPSDVGVLSRMARTAFLTSSRDTDWELRAPMVKSVSFAQRPRRSASVEM